MPVGGSHRAVFKTTGGLSTSDTFDRANGSLGSTDGGEIVPWQTPSGTWSISNNKPVTSDSRDTNPIAVIEAQSPDVTVAMDVSPDGGDAVYFRVADATNWLRLKVNTVSYSFTQSFTQSYQQSYTYSYTQSYTCYATQYCTKYRSSCDYNYASPSSSGCPGCPDEGYCTYTHKHILSCYSYSNSSCCGSMGSLSHAHFGNSSCYCVDCSSHSHGSPVHYSGPHNEGTESCGTYSYTCYKTSYATGYNTAYKTSYQTAYAQEPGVKLEKNVTGTISELGSYPDDPNSLQVTAVGDQITPNINGVSQPSVTESDHAGATKHGFGRGASELGGTGLDNFDLTSI